MNEPRVVVMGVSAVGKTSVGVALANRLNAQFVDADDLHSTFNVAKMTGGEPLTDDDRGPWLEAVATALRAPGSVVVACSALKRSYRDQLRGNDGIEISFILLDAPRPVLVQRIEARTGHFMPPRLLDDQLATLERPGVDESDVVLVLAAGPLDAVTQAAAASLEVN